MTQLERAVAVFGSKSKLARAIGVSPAAVTNWITRGIVPADRCFDIEEATGGVVRAYDLHREGALQNVA